MKINFDLRDFCLPIFGDDDQRQTAAILYSSR